MRLVFKNTNLSIYEKLPIWYNLFSLKRGLIVAKYIYQGAKGQGNSPKATIHRD